MHCLAPQAPALAELCGVNEAALFIPADASPSGDEIQSNNSFLPGENPFTMPSLDYFSFTE